ncbi:hypothetical protein [Emticicia sp. BO119]|uniref:hypothetical protein n=1 Tax=Emticicia sp. BO119 TaxID=2757768 RepID=UPI0015F0D970|nr:hypothetical protein [Emticicia sp. BO119]MBA4851074.1 hypothetical protein [Emticicia sp. BO119]
MNTRYITATLLLLISEFFLIELPEKESVFWIAIARIIAAIVLTVWYYQHRKPLSTLIDKLFILTLIIPVLISLCVIFFPPLIRDFNLIAHACIVCLWAVIFRLMGSKIRIEGSSYKLLKIVPIYALVPILFYIFSLHALVPYLDKILLIIYTFIYLYANTLASFLPINETDKFWIRWGVILMAFANYLVFYSIFVEQLPWLGFIPRTVVVVARCILILGMVDYFTAKKSASVQGAVM